MASITMRSSIEKAYGLKLPMSLTMEDKVELWRKMYEDEPTWMDKDVEPLGIPAAIAGEIARLATIEMDVELTGTPMAEFLDDQLQPLLDNARYYTEFACAKGAVALKPYYNPLSGRIETSIIHADEFFPTRFTGNGKILGAIFPEQVTVGNVRFTRLERHELIKDTYIIENKCFARKIVDSYKSELDALGDPCLLTDVKEWEQLEPKTVISNVKNPLFAYFKMPIANTIEPKSPIGVSVYDRSWKRIRRADDQWARIWWEYKATEAAVHADEDLFKTDRMGNVVLEEKSKRLYRTVEGLKEQMKEFAPSIRDTSLFNGLQQTLRTIEFQSMLAYGTISDVQAVEKTAEEIKSSKHRSFSFIADVQKAFRIAHEDLVKSMYTLAELYGLAPHCDFDAIEQKFDFDDSIAVDRSTAFKELMAMASAGLIKPEYVTAWYFGVDEEKAKEMLPNAFDTTEEKVPPGTEEE